MWCCGSNLFNYLVDGEWRPGSETGCRPPIAVATVNRSGIGHRWGPVVGLMTAPNGVGAGHGTVTENRESRKRGRTRPVRSQGDDAHGEAR